MSDCILKEGWYGIDDEPPSPRYTGSKRPKPLTEGEVAKLYMTMDTAQLKYQCALAKEPKIVSIRKSVNLSEKQRWCMAFWCAKRDLDQMRTTGLVDKEGLERLRHIQT